VLLGGPPPTTPAPRAPNAINFSWLVRLRWGAFIGQTLTILIVDRVMSIPLPLAALLSIVGVEIATNAVCAAIARRGARSVEEWHLAMIMGFDVVLLTALLYFTGGPFNPFSFLYLVHIALAAVILRAGYAWPLLGLSMVSFAGLFFAHTPLELAPGGSEGSGHELHVRGMWVAFGIAAAFIIYFVQRVRRALAERDAELERQKSLAAKSEKLASLASLAAGAAHELSTPLSTIAVIAKEFERGVELERPKEEAREDARLIRQEVERCRTILLHLAEDAGQTSGEPIVAVSIGDLVASAVAELKPADLIRVEIDRREASAVVRVPKRAIAQSLRAVLTNARHASKPEDAITISSTSEPGCVRLAVEDRGRGMPPEHLARCGEPFFTTKDPGKGMGLGLFLARAVLERIGGRLELSSELGRGTIVILVVPRQSETDVANGG
jgi:two-component system, sensor histidine kinase RegB